MPYLVIQTNGQPLEQREITRASNIGRAGDSGLVIRDILLSRRHCRIEPTPEGWTVQDLGSKNGTFVNTQRLTGPYLLKPGDTIRLGRSKLVFTLTQPDERLTQQLSSHTRPVDPNDSMSGTLSGFTLLLPGESDMPTNMPNPQPRPREPQAMADPELQEMLSSLASSSWDSIYAEARQAPVAVPKSDATNEPVRRRARPLSPTDISLQIGAPGDGDGVAKVGLRETGSRENGTGNSGSREGGTREGGTREGGTRETSPVTAAHPSLSLPIVPIVPGRRTPGVGGVTPERIALAMAPIPLAAKDAKQARSLPILDRRNLQMAAMVMLLWSLVALLVWKNWADSNRANQLLSLGQGSSRMAQANAVQPRSALPIPSRASIEIAPQSSAQQLAAPISSPLSVSSASVTSAEKLTSDQVRARILFALQTPQVWLLLLN